MSLSSCGARGSRPTASGAGNGSSSNWTAMPATPPRGHSNATGRGIERFKPRVGAPCESPGATCTENASSLRRICARCSRNPRRHAPGQRGEGQGRGRREGAAALTVGGILPRALRHLEAEVADRVGERVAHRACVRGLDRPRLGKRGDHVLETLIGRPETPFVPSQQKRAPQITEDFSDLDRLITGHVPAALDELPREALEHVLGQFVTVRALRELDDSVANEGVVVLMQDLAHSKPDLLVDGGAISLHVVGQAGVAQRHALDRLGPLASYQSRGAIPVDIGNQEDSKPSASVEHSKAPPGYGLADDRLAALESILELAGDWLIPYRGRVIRRHLGPLLEAWLDHPFELGEARNEQQAGAAHPSIKAQAGPDSPQSESAPWGRGRSRGTYREERYMCICVRSVEDQTPRGTLNRVVAVSAI